MRSGIAIKWSWSFIGWCTASDCSLGWLVRFFLCLETGDRGDAGNLAIGTSRLARFDTIAVGINVFSKREFGVDWAALSYARFGNTAQRASFWEELLSFAL